jgi:hypothetical protein
MLGVRSARKLAGGAGSEDWRWHNGIHVNKMSHMYDTYHTGKNGVKTSKTLSRLRKNSIKTPVPLESSYGADARITRGCSKRLSSKATGESKPDAYPLGYVEDFDEPRTPLADFFSILLAKEFEHGTCDDLPETNL